MMYGNPEIRNYGKTAFRPVLNPEDARTYFLNQRNMYGNPELRSYGKPDFRPVLNPEDARTRFLNLKEVLATPETERSLTLVYCQMLHFSHEPLI